MENTAKGSEKVLADEVFEAQRRKKRVFRTNVTISWIVLLFNFVLSL